MKICFTLILVIWLTACTPVPQQLPESQSPVTESPLISATANTEPAVVQPVVDDTPGPISRELVEKSKADLSKRLEVSPDTIRIAEAQAVTWPDGSLGCPQPGQVYAQVLTPGYWIVLEADDKQYPYHTDETGQLVLCIKDPSVDRGTNEPLPVIPVNPDEIDDGIPWVPVN